MANTLLRVENIGKRFGGVIALKGVSFSIGEAEIVALIGENGAGKSTLMKTLGGVHQPDTGQIYVDEKPVKITSARDAMANNIAFIHQELNVLDNLDVGANIYLGREPKTLGIINSGEIYRQSQVYLDRLGLKVSARTPLSELSIAEQQMVEIAKALSQNARVIIMDEPTSSLTLKETERLLTVCKELRSEGISIIYISHRLSEIIEIADRVVALRDGANAGDLSREKITHDAMVGMMVGRELARFNLPHHTAILDRFVTVKNLRTRRYPDQTVSFDIGRGEILGFAGLVGAGRSEVAQAMFGVEPALEGTMEIGGGGAFMANTASQAISHGVYLVPEDRRKTGLLLDWPIRDNISLPALKRDANKGFINRVREKQIADEQKISLQIKAPNTEARAGNLSGGNQQKVVLAKWLSLNPRMMIFDEPTRGIDVGAKAEIYRIMRELADRGVAVMMISSDMEEVLGVSDRIAVMCEGALTGFLTRAEATEQKVMNLAVARAHEAVV
ncbi:sugar ABC transporter ATP-binding protein [bacterium]|nr:MAG: sugar ABC transporter ATP-binding protein [bacterium]